MAQRGEWAQRSGLEAQRGGGSATDWPAVDRPVSDRPTDPLSRPLLDAPADGADAAAEPRLPLCMLRLLFLLGALSSSSWGRFGTIYYHGKGLSALQIGIVEGTMPLVGVLASTSWAVVADLRKQKKKVYIISSFLGTSALLLLGVGWVVRRSFWRILLVSLGTKLFQSDGILDSFALDCVGPNAPQLYGRLRLWGSVGWGTAALAMGAINDKFGFGPNFYIFAGSNYLMLTLLAFAVPSDPGRSKSRLFATTDAEGPSKPSKSALWEVVTSRHCLAFLGEVFVFGACVGVVERLLFLYIVDDLRGDSTLCGLVVFVSSAFNIPVFQNAGFLLKRVGHARLMALSQLCYFTRVFGYTLLQPKTKYFVLVLETLHGCTFAMLWIAAVERARMIAPPGWGATLQTLLATTYYSLGPGVGALVGGYVWHRTSARVMYRGFAATAMILFLIRVVALCFERRQEDDDVPTALPRVPSESYVSLADAEPLAEADGGANARGPRRGPSDAALLDAGLRDTA
ncbi:major facilitator superfamily domain-containing protein [Pelagophyceae sp. CCMP2097]|nr:major facilitator superfamily domain-containing protein [Pelagophyceae sp. CCMP2097]